MPGRDTPLNSLTLRLILAALGTLFLGLGLAGVFLPLLPTTPFLLLAAACYARSSRRIHRWLLAHPSFGPIIRQWQATRTMPRRAKRVALVLIALSFTVSIVFFVPDWRGQLVMALAGVILWSWVARIPTRDTDAAG
ncbi:MAG: YbaN family protein [Thiobacillaceae bacterium]|nr:YbaN family protein [Thiobacillaceae bacterium]MDW8324047.1 YbaN family protein [Burkholderiales bacterium]